MISSSHGTKPTKSTILLTRKKKFPTIYAEVIEYFSWDPSLFIREPKKFTVYSSSNNYNLGNFLKKKKTATKISSFQLCSIFFSVNDKKKRREKKLYRKAFMKRVHSSLIIQKATSPTCIIDFKLLFKNSHKFDFFSFFSLVVEKSKRIKRFWMALRCDHCVTNCEEILLVIVDCCCCCRLFARKHSENFHSISINRIGWWFGGAN